MLKKKIKCHDDMLNIPFEELLAGSTSSNKSNVNIALVPLENFNKDVALFYKDKES